MTEASDNPMFDWVQKNQEKIDELGQQAHFKEEEISYLKAGMNKLMFNIMKREPTNKEFTWPSTGKKTLRWFYHYDEGAVLVPNSVHLKIVALSRRYGKDLIGVEIEAEGEGKQRRYNNVFPLLKGSQPTTKNEALDFLDSFED